MKSEEDTVSGDVSPVSVDGVPL